MAECLTSLYKLWIQSYHCWEENKKEKKRWKVTLGFLHFPTSIIIRITTIVYFYFETMSQIAQAVLELAMYPWMTLNFWSSQVLRLQTCTATPSDHTRCLVCTFYCFRSSQHCPMGWVLLFLLSHKWIYEGMGAVKGLVQIVFLVDWFSGVD